jgi:hypothetical protein
MNKNKRAPSYGMGSGPKHEIDLSTRRIVPGPGNYDSELRNSQFGGISFAKAIRQGERNHGIPGPGTYRVPVKFADVPKYILPSQEDRHRFV